jgi:large subunit ribosomal protein L29
MKTKARDLRQLTVKELGEKAAGLEEELFNLRFQASMGQLSNPLRLRIVRKDAARVKTVLGEKIRSEKAAAGAQPAGASRDASKDAPSITPKVAVKDVPKVAQKETAKEETKKATKKMTKKVAKKVTKKATK